MRYFILCLLGLFFNLNGMEIREFLPDPVHPDQPLNLYNPPFHSFPWHNHTYIQTALEQGLNVNARDEDTGRPFVWFYIAHLARKKTDISQDDLNLIDCMVAYSLDINQVNNYGTTVLHPALIHLCTDLVEKCILAGVTINAQDNGGSTVFNWVLSRPCGLDEDLKKEEGQTVSIVEMLLVYGADVTIKNKNKEGPLFAAARMHNHYACDKIIPMLLFFGADSQEVNASNMTPYDYAQRHKKSSEIITMLQDKVHADKAKWLYPQGKFGAKNLESIQNIMMLISYRESF